MCKKKFVMKLKKNPTGSHAQSAAFVLLKVVCLDPSDWTSSLFGTKGYIAITQILWSLFYDAHIFMDFFILQILHLSFQVFIYLKTAVQLWIRISFRKPKKILVNASFPVRQKHNVSKRKVPEYGDTLILYLLISKNFCLPPI